MKVIEKHKRDKGARLSTKEIPKVGQGEILVKVKAASICGTDYHIYSWDKWSQDHINPPLVAGHEFSGEVIEVADDVSRIKKGDNVSAETHIVCGKCEMCRTGKGHICQETKILGVDIDGAFAEYVKIPADNAIKNDKDVEPGLLSIQEPLGNAVQTVLSGEIVSKSIAVVGCGPIGLMAVNVAKASGASKIIALEINEYRRNLAKELGADVVINPLEEDPIKRVLEETNGNGVDVVAELSGNEKAIKQAFKYIKLGGRFSMLGIPNEEVSINIADDIVFKGITIDGIVGRKMYETWYKVQGLIESGSLDLDKIITHRLSFDEFEKGMELMKSGNCGKVILYPNK
ncbi:MAG: L-threonine 3-dehydrogenase [Bacillota bacterium]